MNNKKKVLSLVLLASMVLPYGLKTTFAQAKSVYNLENRNAKQQISVVTYDQKTKESTKTVGELTFILKKGYPKLKEVKRFTSKNGVADIPDVEDGLYKISLEENNYYTLQETNVDITNGEFKTDDDDAFVITVEKKKGIDVPLPKEDDDKIEKALIVKLDNEFKNLKGVKFEISETTGENKKEITVDNNSSLNIEVKENKNYKLKLISDIYEMKGITFTCKKEMSEMNLPVYKLIGDDKKEITFLNLTKKVKEAKEKEFTFDVLCGSCGKISIAKELVFLVKDKEEVKEYKSNQGIVKFKLKEGKKYKLSLKKDADYSMDTIEIEVKNENGELKVYSGDKILTEFVMKKISDSECVESLCDFSDKKVTMKEIPVKVEENDESRDLKSDEEVIFTLYNTSKSEFVGEVKTVNGKLPALEVFEKDDYILFTSEKNTKFKMADTPFFKEVSELYFKSQGDGKLPIRNKTKNPYSTGANLNINFIKVRPLKKDEKINKKYKVDYIRIIQDKENPKDYSKVKVIFTSEYETVTATTLQEDAWGVPLTEIELLENVQYSVRVEDPENKYAIENFPLALVDKSERGPNHPKKWGDGKYVFNHSYCGNATFLKLVEKGKENDHNTTIVCSNGNTTVSGMNFRDLKLRTSHPDKSEITTLNGKDFDLFSFKLINPKRCEVTKMADGNFTIHRKIKDGKLVKKVYQVNKDKTLKELKFKQNKDIVDINTKTLSIYDTVILYKSEEDKKLDKEKENAVNELDKLNKLTNEEKESAKVEIENAKTKEDVTKALENSKNLNKTKKDDSTTPKTGNSGNTTKTESNKKNDFNKTNTESNKKDDFNKGKNETDTQNKENKQNLTNTDLNKEEVKFIFGENQTVNLKDCKNIEFKLNQKVEDFVNLYVDEVLVDKSMYIVKKGSTVVEVKKEFLDTLKSGSHEFKFEFKKGIAKTNVVLENSKKENKEENKNTKNKEPKKQNLPKTNISSISLNLISALGVSILGAFESLKRRK